MRKGEFCFKFCHELLSKSQCHCSLHCPITVWHCYSYFSLSLHISVLNASLIGFSTIVNCFVVRKWLNNSSHGETIQQMKGNSWSMLSGCVTQDEVIGKIYPNSACNSFSWWIISISRFLLIIDRDNLEDFLPELAVFFNLW